MPNVTSNSQVETSSNSLPSTKSKKNKRKSLAVTTSKDVSPSRQESHSPNTLAPDTADVSLENGNKNPYIEVINKRIRTLRKKMTRIEKCEEIIRSSPDGKSQLNNDQLQLYERKGEIAGALKECEDILKQVENIDKEEIKNQRILKEQQDEREKATANAITDEVKATYSRSIICLLQFFRLVHFQQVGIVQLSQAESEAVETFRAKLTNVVDEVKDDISELRIQETLDNINKLQHGDESTVIEPLTNGTNDTNCKLGLGVLSHGITYSHIRSLILSPPILDSVEIQTEQEEPYDTREVVNVQGEGPTHFDENLGDMYTIPVGGLQFMLPRGEPSSQDIIDHNHTSYSYPNTDVDQGTQLIETTADIQEQYQQQQQHTFTEPYMVEQQQQYSVEHQHITEHQPEQTDQQQQVSMKQKEEPSVQQQEPNQVSDNSTDVQQQVLQPNDTSSPPTHSNNYKGNHRNNYRNRGGYRTQGGQGSRRDNGGYRDGGYRDGRYRGERGYSNSGSRGGRGGGNGYQGGHIKRDKSHA